MRTNDQNEMKPDDVLKALNQLQPTELESNRDELMFRAGFEAAIAAGSKTRNSGRQLSLWKATSGLMTAATITLAILLVREKPATDPAPVAETNKPKEPSIVEIETPEPAVTDREETDAVLTFTLPQLAGDPSSNYFALRAAVLSRGLDAWPVQSDRSTDSASSPPIVVPTLLEIRQQLLPEADVPRAKPTEPEVPNTKSTHIDPEESVV